MTLLYSCSWISNQACTASGASSADEPTTAESVFAAYAPRVYALARRMLANDADAEDVTQDVLLRVVCKLDTFRGEAGLATWLHRVTVNAALIHRRKQSRRREYHVDAPLDALPDRAARSVTGQHEPPDQRMLTRELQGLIERAIACLPELYRDVYVLGDVEDRPNAEIGELLGLSRAAVKSRLYRARLMMRVALAPHF
jgi:RNA polymerase sigma-70 factor (ECF subfamily)